MSITHARVRTTGTTRKMSVFTKEDRVILSAARKTKCAVDVAALLGKPLSYALQRILALEERGVISLQFPCEDPTLQKLYAGGGSSAAMCKKQPGLCNIMAYEREWGVYPDSFDFLNKDSKLFWLKELEKELYLDLVRPFLDRLPAKSVILDAGAGIGRFAVGLLKRGFRVHLVDASQTALKKALKYLLKEKKTGFDLHWGNVDNLSMFSDGSFDALLALEVICYCARPADAVKELARVTKKNGLVIISVEGKYGGMLSDPNVSLDALPAVFRKGSLLKKGRLHVHYYTPESLKKLLEDNGIRVTGIVGSHYVTDGVFHGLIDMDALSDKSYRQEVSRVERLCRQDPLVRHLARAWVAVGRKR